jgi:anaerobic selenocysteine-containing dehydrogenase
MEGPSLVPSICPYCGLGCGFFIIRENGTAVGLEYKKDHPTVTQPSMSFTTRSD